MRLPLLVCTTIALFAASGDARAQEPLAPAPPPTIEPTVLPQTAVYLPLATQARLGVDVIGSLRYRALGSEYVSSQVDARLALLRSFGRFLVGAHGMVGRGALVRQDVDFEAGALAAVTVARGVRIGGEARVRGELEDRFATEEDEGRPFELLSGALVGATIGKVYVQTTGGWMVPRGIALPGPAAITTATLSF